MAKTDFSKDYYADLELPPTADINEVKKQFRKLALKYHPDRNPGTGNEFNIKFQTIQAANEVLSNPDTKSRYDAQRGRNRGYPTSSGVRGNPWSNVSSQFPTPPKRGEARPPKPPPRPTPTASSRYSNFNVPPTRSTKEDPQTTYQAWQNMKGKSAQPSTSGQSSQARADKRPQPGPPPAPTARTASQKQKAEASFGNRKGFMPQSPIGDEPPVSSSNYFSSNRPPMFPETPVKPRRASHMEPGTTFRDSSADERQSTPYRSHGGEKLNPFDGATNLNRAKSTRESARFQGQETDNPPRKHKSSEDMSPSQNGAPFGGETPRTFAARMGERSGGVDGSEKPKPPPARPEQTTYDPNFFAPPSSSFAFGAGIEPVPPSMSTNYGNLYSRQNGSEIGSSSSATMNSFEEMQLKTLQELLERQPEFVAAVDKAAHLIHEHQSKRADTTSATSFSFPRNDVGNDSSSNTRPFMTSSAENINTSFVAEDHAGPDYQFNAGGPSDETNATAQPTARRTQSGSRLRRRPTAQESRQARPSQSAETLSPDRSDTKSSGFNIDDWQGQFGAMHFEPPAPGVQSSSSPTRGPRLARKSRPVQRTMGSAGMVDDDDQPTSGEDIRGRGPMVDDATRANVESPGAMDIDPPLAPSNGARNINVEPSRPDWRAGDAKAGAPEPPARPPKQPIPSFSTNNAAGSEDTDDLRTNLADLKNIAPLAPSGTGFESLHDLKNHLPFESKASSRLHLDTESPVQKEPTRTNFPRTPVAPRPPVTISVPGITPTARAWEDYVNAFGNYLLEWQSFNARFVDHFQARRAEIDKQSRAGGLAWVQARGDAGLNDYMAWMEQDQEIHARWTELCNQHARKVAEFKTFRQTYVDKLN